LAQGQGDNADRIIALAREAGIEVLEDPVLAAMLDAGAQVGDIIPVWCWEAVAKILAFVAAQDHGELKRNRPGAGIGVSCLKRK
jgi:flagellar biosynthesis protein